VLSRGNGSRLARNADIFVCVMGGSLDGWNCSHKRMSNLARSQADQGGCCVQAITAGPVAIIDPTRKSDSSMNLQLMSVPNFHSKGRVVAQ